MKKIFPIIGHVFLGVILLVFFCVVSLMLFDSQQEHYLWISLALSILLSIIIPIRRYKKAIKNKEHLSLEVNNIESLKNELSKKFSWMFIIIVGLITLVVVLNYEKPYENKDLDSYLKNLKKNEAPKTTSTYDQRYDKCYTEMTVAHSRRGLLKSNIELSVNVRRGICKAYAKGEEINYEGKR